MRVFFDASVMIAALLSPTGGSAQLFKYIKLSKLIGMTSQTAVAEVLQKTFKLNKSNSELEEFIAHSGLIVRESITQAEIVPYQNLVDRDDAHLIAGAKLTRCEYLVTLDKKHLLRTDIYKLFLPLQIVSPKSLLEKILENSLRISQK